MASAAGLLSPGLVSLVKRAQKVRQEMDGYSSSAESLVYPQTNGKRGCVILPLFVSVELKRILKPTNFISCMSDKLVKLGIFAEM